MNVAQRLFDKAHKLSAILQLDFDMGLVFSDRRIRNRRYPLAHSLDDWVIHGSIGILLKPRLTADETDGRAVVDRVLPFEPARDVLLIAQIDHKRRDANADGLNSI